MAEFSFLFRPRLPVLRFGLVSGGWPSGAVLADATGAGA